MRPEHGGRGETLVRICIPGVILLAVCLVAVTPASAEQVMPIGTYLVSLAVEGDGRFDYPVFYSGSVEVNWSDPVAALPATWGGIKCRYFRTR